MDIIKNRKIWTDALRSGRYKQGFSRLIQYYKEEGEPRYCALGVLCEVMGYPKVEGKQYMNVGTFQGASAACPSSVMEMVGLQSALGTFVGGSLTQYNDGRRMNFAELADLIESEPAGLFT